MGAGFRSLVKLFKYHSAVTDQFRSDLASQTINYHRSMLSMTVDPIEGHRIGYHPLVVQLLKGCFNSKPPRARYNLMWDPDVMLKYFQSLPEKKELSLIVTFHKLATLIALSCLLRVSEIAAISVSSISISASAANFSISRPRKTQHVGTLRSFSLPRLSGPSCPIDCLANYVERTVTLRPHGTDALLVSLKRTYRAVGWSTIGRWVKQCLISAGVNSDFGVHSTRDSAASKASHAGVPVEQILKAASWSSESVFNRFTIVLPFLLTMWLNVSSHKQTLIFKVTVKVERNRNIIEDYSRVAERPSE